MILHRLEGSAVRLVTIGAKGRMTVPAKLRERRVEDGNFYGLERRAR